MLTDRMSSCMSSIEMAAVELGRRPHERRGVDREASRLRFCTRTHGTKLWRCHHTLRAIAKRMGSGRGTCSSTRGKRRPTVHVDQRLLLLLVAVVGVGVGATPRTVTTTRLLEVRVAAATRASAVASAVASPPSASRGAVRNTVAATLDAAQTPSRAA